MPYFQDTHMEFFYTVSETRPSSTAEHLALGPVQVVRYYNVQFIREPCIKKYDRHSDAPPAAELEQRQPLKYLEVWTPLEGRSECSEDCRRVDYCILLGNQSPLHHYYKLPLLDWAKLERSTVPATGAVRAKSDVFTFQQLRVLSRHYGLARRDCSTKKDMVSSLLRFLKVNPVYELYVS